MQGKDPSGWSTRGPLPPAPQAPHPPPSPKAAQAPREDLWKQGDGPPHPECRAPPPPGGQTAGEALAFLLGSPALPTGCAGPGLGHRLPELSFQGSARNPRPGRLCGPSGGSWPGRAGRKCAHPADLTSLPAILVSSLSSGRRVSPLSLPFGRSHVFQSPPHPCPSPPLFSSSLLSRRLGSTPGPPGPAPLTGGAEQGEPGQRAEQGPHAAGWRSAAQCLPAAAPPGPAPARPQEMLAARAKIPGRLRALRLARSAPSGDPGGGGACVPAWAPPQQGEREDASAGLPAAALPAQGSKSPFHSPAHCSSGPGPAPRAQAFLRPQTHKSLIPSDSLALREGRRDGVCLL